MNENNGHMVDVQNLVMHFPVTAGVFRRKVADHEAVRRLHRVERLGRLDRNEEAGEQQLRDQRQREYVERCFGAFADRGNQQADDDAIFVADLGNGITCRRRDDKIGE